MSVVAACVGASVSRPAETSMARTPMHRSTPSSGATIADRDPAPPARTEAFLFATRRQRHSEMNDRLAQADSGVSSHSRATATGNISSPAAIQTTTPDALRSVDAREKRLKIAFRLQATDRGAECRCLPEIDRGWRIWPGSGLGTTFSATGSGSVAWGVTFAAASDAERRAERTNPHANRIATLASAIHACFRSVALASATAFDSASRKARSCSRSSWRVRVVSVKSSRRPSDRGRPGCFPVRVRPHPRAMPRLPRRRRQRARRRQPIPRGATRSQRRAVARGCSWL